MNRMDACVAPVLIVWPKHSAAATPMTGPISTGTSVGLSKARSSTQPIAAVGGRRRAILRRRELGLALGARALGWAGLGEVLAPRADAGGVDDARGAAEGDWERGGDMARGGEAGCPSTQASRANMRRQSSPACRSKVPENKAPVLYWHRAHCVVSALAPPALLR